MSPLGRDQALLWTGSHKVCGNTAGLRSVNPHASAERRQQMRGESSQDAAQPSLRQPCGSESTSVLQGTASRPSPARHAGMSNPCPRPVIQRGKPNKARERPCRATRARKQNTLPASPQLPREPDTCSGGRRSRAGRRPPG